MVHRINPLPKEITQRYSWEERQAWECGFTPKCCSCKWSRPLDEGEKPNQLGDRYCVNVGRARHYTCAETLKRNGRSRVNWNDSCFFHEWIYADIFHDENQQIGLEDMNESDRAY